MEAPFFKFSSLSKFPEIIHGISTRAYGNMHLGKSNEAKENRQNFFLDLEISLQDTIGLNQVHAANVIPVGEREKENQLKLSGDGLITREKGIYLAITIADCLPVLIYDPTLEIVCLVHAGWRGVIGQIIPKAIEKFRQFLSEPQNLMVGIGPGICQKHFVVKNDVLEKFKDLYPSATFVRNHDGYVDLKKAVLIDLKHAGIPRHNVEIASDCPVCHPCLYGSFRKEGEGAPASLAVIGMR